MKSTMKSVKRGFTLIELLVVIAIIGILSAIVIVNLMSARNKANDAKVKSQLSSFKAAAELYNQDHGNSYAGMGTATSDTNVGPLLSATAYPNGVGPVVTAATSTWVATHALTAANTYACVDSTGASATASTSATGTSVSCSNL